MSDIVKTTGRPMTLALQRALDTVDEREATISSFEHMARESNSPLMARLYAALALELRLVDLRENDTLLHMRREWSDSIPEPPLPQPPRNGKTAWYDPETKTFHDTPPDNAA